MKILINNETQPIFYYGNNNIMLMKYFQKIVKWKNKNALITLARNLNFKNTKFKLSGHVYYRCLGKKKRKYEKTSFMY